MEAVRIEPLTHHFFSDTCSKHFFDSLYFACASLPVCPAQSNVSVKPPETLSQVIFQTPTTPDLFFHTVCAALGTGQMDRSRPLAVSIFSVMPIISLPACTPKPL